jgi:hypothetical protein
MKPQEKKTHHKKKHHHVKPFKATEETDKIGQRYDD